MATPDFCSLPACRLRDQDAWTRQQLQQNGTRDQYWHGIDLVMHQFDGMVEGYEARRQSERRQGADGVQLPELGKDGFLFTNGNGELVERKETVVTAQLSGANLKRDCRGRQVARAGQEWLPICQQEQPGSSAMATVGLHSRQAVSMMGACHDRLARMALSFAILI